MDTEEFSAQCKIRQCFQCHGDTEFYCNTCKHDLCLKCKGRHVTDLDTINHDVVIYLEKYEYSQKQETCVKHHRRIYKKYCHLCKLPVCSKCTEHEKHQIQDIRTAYKTNRQLQRKFFHKIRSETLYNSYFLLAGIKTEIKTCHLKIISCQSEMFKMGQKLKNLINTVVFKVKIRYTRYIIRRLKQQKESMNRHLVSIESYEHRSDPSANRPVRYLLLLKKTYVPKMKDTPNLTQHFLLSLTEEMNMENVIKLLSEMQISQTGKREVRNECLLKLMSTPVLHKSVTVTGVGGVNHISCVTSDQVWVSDHWDSNLILTNTAGETLHHLTDVSSGWGVHTVNMTGNLIYIDKDFNINKLSKDNRTMSTLIKKTDPCRLRCIYCSPSNGDLLVGMYNIDINMGMITRYNDTGQLIQTIPTSNTDQGLYNVPSYIAENRNGDVIVSDSVRRAVVVTERQGRHRFSYRGPPSGSGILPLGICTDALSHILVCDGITHTVQMIDKDGHLLSVIQTQQQGINFPWGLSYDDKCHLLWIGSLNNNRVCVYRYIKRRDCPTSNSIS